MLLRATRRLSAGLLRVSRSSPSLKAIPLIHKRLASSRRTTVVLNVALSEGNSTQSSAHVTSAGAEASPPGISTYNEAHEELGQTAFAAAAAAAKTSTGNRLPDALSVPTPDVVDALRQLRAIAARSSSMQHSADGGRGQVDDEEVELQPAWQAALSIAETYSSNLEVAEWVLFLCLRRHTTGTAEPAPFEVCEGMYKAWKALRQSSTSSVESSHKTVRIQRSPFHPKGLYHHYAAHLLEEFHDTQSALQQLRRECQGRRGHTASDEHGTAISPLEGEMEFNEADALHHSYGLLNRILELLLVELPLDVAYSTALSSHKQSPSRLRPSSALLVLEAARQLLQLISSDPLPARAQAAVESFPLLQFLLNEDAGVSGTGTTHLRDAARGAFELALSASVGTSISVAQEALVLYMGFLLAASQKVSVNAIDRFVLAGLFSAPPSTDLDGGEAERTAHNLSDSQILSLPPTLAPVLHLLLRTYLVAGARTAPTADRPTRTAMEERKILNARPEVCEAFLALVSQPTPLPLLRCLLSSEEGHMAGIRSRLVEPWCAWMLRVLLCGDGYRGPPTTATASSAQSRDLLPIATALIVKLHQRPRLMERRPSQKRHTQKHRRVARNAPQHVWRVLFENASHGSLLDDSAFSSPTPSAVPALLTRLCYPYYRRDEWRRGSVNAYVQLLDAWAQASQVREVVSTIVRREGDIREQVQAAILGSASEGSEGRLEEIAGSNSAGSVAVSEKSSLDRYQPTLTLESCLLALKYCGCPSSALTVGGEGRVDNTDSPTIGTPLSASTALRQARLAGEVLQYMLCAMHVSKHRARVSILRRSEHQAVEPPETLSDETEVDNQETDREDPQMTRDDDYWRPHSVLLDGRPLEQWVAWFRQSGVPAVERLFKEAGREEEWDALGY